MGHVTARYFDGCTSARHEVQLFIEKDTLRVLGKGISLAYQLSTIKLSDSVGSVARTVKLPDDGVCEVADAGFIAHLEKACNIPGHRRWISLWEKNLPLVLGGLMLLCLVIAAFFRYGVPLLASRVAFALPQDIEARIGQDVMSTLDKMIFKPSALSDERQKELTLLFKSIKGGTDAARLEFRACPAMGANAVTLPSGIVVMTDGLVALAENDDELAAVLAHELGHAKLRHGLRHVLQNSLTVLVMSTLTGDLVSVTSFSAALPTALVDASFSRAFEDEADEAAMAWMRSAGVDPRRYAGILARLEAQHTARHGGEPSFGRKIGSYLSTHPDTEERIKKILQGR